MASTYIEPSNELPVYAECDVLVVGSGAAGHSAAVAAARAGAKKVILMERYGYSGGDVTGAYVLMVPKLSWKTLPFVRGIQEEWFERMEKSVPGSTWGPRMEDIGKQDKTLMRRVELNRLVGDSTKARKELGWEPSITFEEMIKRMTENDLKALE